MVVISENKVDIDFILDWISDWTHGVSCSHKSLGCGWWKIFGLFYNLVISNLSPSLFVVLNRVDKLS